MEAIDRKYNISATCLEQGHAHTEMDSVLFLAKDKALPATLEFYRQECARLGAEQIQLQGIDLLIFRVHRWQIEHADKVKVADIDMPAGESIIEPNE